MTGDVATSNELHPSKLLAQVLVPRVCQFKEQEKVIGGKKFRVF